MSLLSRGAAAVECEPAATSQKCEGRKGSCTVHAVFPRDQQSFVDLPRWHCEHVLAALANIQQISWQIGMSQLYFKALQAGSHATCKQNRRLQLVSCFMLLVALSMTSPAYQQQGESLLHSPPCQFPFLLCRSRFMISALRKLFGRHSQGTQKQYLTVVMLLIIISC